MTMELRITNNNNHGESTPATAAWPTTTCKTAPVNIKQRPKRDFRFQVIQVHQGPKWFIWPTKKERRMSMNENAAKKEGDKMNNNNDEANNNAANVKTRTSGSRKVLANAPERILNLNTTRNGQKIDLSAVDGEMTPVTASSQPHDSPTSEPTTRRLSTKLHKAQTEPLSTSAPSSTFKILSICKKWESLDTSDEELDDMEDCSLVPSCRQMSLSLDQTSQNALSSSPPNNENQVR
uniref:Uncharacterized protein n=2 Tax=Parascaris univalens TaxID=6257 RepID=A0A915B5B5_PARUN